MKFTSFIKKAAIGLVAFAALATPLALHASHAKAGFGPDRQVFDYTKGSDNSNCSDPNDPGYDHGRCGSLTGPVFDSFINTNVYGDERNFTRIAPVVAGQSPVDADYSKENVPANADGEYWVRVYVHNNANQGINDATHNFAGVATNTKVRLEIAQGQANGVDVMGSISADNAAPGTVWDSGTLVNDSQKFSVSYENGSAMIYNQAHQSGAALSDDIVGANGTQIGFDQMDGKVPGCFQYSAYVFVKVKVNTPKVQISKQTREVVTDDKGVKTGVGTYSNTMGVKPGDLVAFHLHVKNTGSTFADHVTVRDTLPAGLTLDPGSILLVTPGKANETLPDNALTAGGDDLSSFAAGADSDIYMRAVVGKPVDDTCKIVNTAFVKGDNSPETSDSATLTFDQSLCEHPSTPSFTCDTLAINQDATNKRKVTFTVTAGHDSTTQVTSYVLDFGDGSTPLTTNTNPYTYTYAKDGTFSVVAKVNFTLADGTPKNNVSGDKCIAKVTTSSKPPVLPNTGSGLGSLVAMFSATSVIGAFLYRSRALRSIR